MTSYLHHSFIFLGDLLQDLENSDGKAKESNLEKRRQQRFQREREMPSLMSGGGGTSPKANAARTGWLLYLYGIARHTLVGIFSKWVPHCGVRQAFRAQYTIYELICYR